MIQECNDIVEWNRGSKSLGSFLMRFNTAAATVDRPNPSVILMAAVSEVASKIDFKVALQWDLPIDLAEFYHKAKSYLR